MPNCWLVKQEPSTYSFQRLVKDERTTWDGVRNPQARIHLRAMKKGDDVLFYHSGDEKAVVGMARIEKEAYADPTDRTKAWVAVDLAPVEPLARPVTLAEVKADPALAQMMLVRLSRLSVMPVSPAEKKRILALATVSPS